jgi:Asp-tRNA(Asn)/Glu-tRNA(Gln) amidotransferase A subunit family amidase
MTDLAFASAAELALMIRNREISPVELMGAMLARIERSQPTLNAFITIAAEPAMAAARAAEAAVMRGAPLGPLHGVPLAVKDVVPTARIRTTWGSLIFKDHIPETDAEVVARLKRAGAIVVGKTTTPEFGQQCLTEAPLFGRTRNAWRADRSSGGSSGGSAVAVAAGLVPIAVATDGGGSTRIPAACNGVVGFKQGLGMVPQEYAQDGFGNISYITPRTRLYRQVQSWFDTCDIVAMPTLSRSAVPIDQDFFGPIEIDGEPVENIRAAWYPYTMPFNLTGNPAVSLPAGFDGTGMPLAIQLVAPVGADAALLRVSAAFERACPWADRRPPLAAE